MSSLPADQSQQPRGRWLPVGVSRWFGPLVTLCASLGTFGFFAVQGILLARLLGPEMRGAFAAAVLFPQALLYLGLLGAPELFAGYAARGADDGRLRRSAARYGLCAGMVMLGACVVLNAIFIRDQFRWVLPLACLCALALPLQQIRLAVQAVDHGQRQWNRYNQGRLLAAAAFPAALAVAFIVGVTDLRWICVLFVASQATALLLAQRGMRQSWRGRGEVPVRRAIREARPLIAAWLASELLERLDMCLMLALVSDEATLGYYAAATPIAAMMIIVPNAAGLYAFNRGARSDEIPPYRAVWWFLLGGVAFQAISAIVFAALLPWLVRMLYGATFAPTVVFAWLLLPAGVFRGLLQAIDGYLRARGKASVSVATRLTSTAILIILSLGLPSWLAEWGLPAAYGIPIGLSVALGFCFVAMAIAMLADVASHHAVRNAAEASQLDSTSMAFTTDGSQAEEQAVQMT